MLNTLKCFFGFHDFVLTGRRYYICNRKIPNKKRPDWLRRSARRMRKNPTKKHIYECAQCKKVEYRKSKNQ